MMHTASSQSYLAEWALMNPYRALALLLSAMVVAAYSKLDFGPRVGASWVAPRDRYACGVVIYVMVILILYFVVCGLLFSWLPHIPSMLIDSRTTPAVVALTTGPPVEFASVPDASSGGDVGAKESIDGDILPYSMGLAVTIALFRVPLAGRLLRLIRDAIRRTVGMPGYVEEMAASLRSARYLLPASRRPAVEGMLERLGVPTQSLSWRTGDDDKARWTRLASLVYSLKQMQSDSARSSHTDHMTQGLVADFCTLSQSAARVFSLDTLHRQAFQRVLGRAELQTDDEIDIARRIQKHLDLSMARLVVYEFRKDRDVLIARGLRICARISAETPWTRIGVSRRLESIGFCRDDVRAASQSPVWLLLLFAGMLGAFSILGSLIPIVAAILRPNWGATMEGSPLSLDRAMKYSLIYFGAVWAAVICRRFWGWAFRGHWLVGLVTAVLIATAVWSLVGLIWNLLSIRPESTAASLSLGSAVRSGLGDLLGRSHWLLPVCAAAVGTYLLCGWKSRYLGRWQWIVESLAMGAMLAGAVIGVCFIRERSLDEYVRIAIVNGCVGLLIGAMVPQWQRQVSGMGAGT